MKKKAFLFLLLLMTFIMSSQRFFNKPVFVSPGISVGYTFGARFNYGFCLDVGLLDKGKTLNSRYGFSFYEYFVHTHQHTHRLRSFSLMYQNDYLDLKGGIGRAKNPWGYGHRNKCIVRGLAFDVSASYPSPFSPWIGYRLFKYPQANWAWYMKPYQSVYIKYKYDIIQNTELKNTVTLEKKNQ